jgi:hypothetical protein
MGPLYYDCAPYRSTLHQLHTSAEESRSCTRDSDIDIWRLVVHAGLGGKGVDNF